MSPAKYFHTKGLRPNIRNTRSYDKKTDNNAEKAPVVAGAFSFYFDLYIHYSGLNLTKFQRLSRLFVVRCGVLGLDMRFC
jgi:hypothetical protein